MPNYWMLVTTTENYQITQDKGFTIQGVRSKHRRKAQRMQPKDRLLYYIRPLQRFPGVATIMSTFWEEHVPIWHSTSAQEDFPYRVQVRPDTILEEDDYLDARELGPTLQYVRRWIPEDWHLAFYEDLHLLPQRDFALIEGEMQKLARKRNSSPNGTTQ
jgi:predicted RNA-binding protein